MQHLLNYLEIINADQRGDEYKTNPIIIRNRNLTICEQKCNNYIHLTDIYVLVGDPGYC